MSSEEYNLKKSEDKIGQLYPVLLSKDGKVIDGFHRLESDKEWKTETLDHIDDEEKLLLARCVSNWHRRAVTRSEKAEWINGLAKIYEKQGLKVSRARHDGGGVDNEIKNKLMEVTGLSERSIIRYLHSEFKQVAPPEVSRRPRVPASQVIETLAKSSGYEPGTIVERHREEVREEVKAEVKAEAKAEAKEELRKDPDFIIQTAETALEILPTLKPKVTTPEGYHKPTLTLQQKEKLVEAAQRVEEKKRKRATGPDAPRLKEIGKYNRILTGLLSMSALLYRVECPITGNSAETDLVFKESGLTVKQAMQICDKKLMELRT